MKKEILSSENSEKVKILVIVIVLAIVLTSVAGVIYFLYPWNKSRNREIIWIHNIYELQNISKNLNGHYVLANDIDASITRVWNNGKGFKPIGNYSSRFTGIFDGNGHKIINLYINRPLQHYVGLFGCILNPSIIKNVGLVNVNVIGRFEVGGLVGYDDTGTVSNSYVTGIIHGEKNDVGGLIGRSYFGSISNCYSKANVGGGGDNVGGLIGIKNYGTVNNCYSTGDVRGGSEVGGLVGRNLYGKVNNSYETGNVTGNVNGEGNYIGGLVGDNDGKISNCYATGNVNGSGEVGGLVGSNWGTINNSYAIGNLNGVYHVGGLAGSNLGTINSSYSTGNVQGNDKYVGGLIGDSIGSVNNCYATGNVNGKSFVGGLVGWHLSPGEIRYTYAVGHVNGISKVGGLVGYNEDGTIIASFWDKNSTGQNTSDGGMGKTTNEMKEKETYISAGWDFTNVWDIIDGVSYPFLRWQNDTNIPRASNNYMPKLKETNEQNKWINENKNLISLPISVNVGILGLACGKKDAYQNRWDTYIKLT